MNKTRFHIGKMIRKARKEIGLSQKDFANVLHVSDKTISSYEVGRAMPGFNTLLQISKVVQKPISYFDSDVEHEDIDLQIKLAVIEKELLEIKKILAKRNK
jgi:transcriptional regulator with XRE-family HTH domain